MRERPRRLARRPSQVEIVAGESEIIVAVLRLAAAVVAHSHPWAFGWEALVALGTLVLAVAAWRALAQLGELKRDRHVQILVEMGRRWEAAEMTEALQESRDYTPNELAKLVKAARTGPKGDPTRAIAEKKLAVLMRVPNYFEDAAVIARRGRMETDLIEDYFGGVAIDEWSTWEPAIRKIQEKDARAYEEFERLAKEDEREEIEKQAGTRTRKT